MILSATGSEVALAVEAHEKLVAEGVRSRLVSMPSRAIFEHQTQECRESVLPPGVKARVAAEQASTPGWERYVGPTGRVIGMKTFGAAQRAPDEIRLRTGPGRGGRERTTGEMNPASNARRLAQSSVLAELLFFDRKDDSRLGRVIPSIPRSTARTTTGTLSCRGCGQGSA